MAVNPNGTYAKDIVLHFITKKGWRVTGSLMMRQVVIVKRILSAGFTKEEIIDSIDYILDIQGTDISSLGYVEVAINDILDKVKVLKIKNANKSIKHVPKGESDEEVSKRNKEKASTFGKNETFTKQFEGIFKKDE